MSDRASVEITLVSGVAGHETELAELFGEWSGWTEDSSLPANYVDGFEVTDEEAVLGILNEVGPELERMGISYYGEQSAKFEWNAVVRLFTPELGWFESPSNGEGLVLVAAHIIDNILKLCDDMLSDPEEWRQEIHRRLDRVSGKAHRDALYPS